MKTDTRLLIADDWNEYALLDSGHLQKLERFGSQTVIRPDPQAFWEPARP
ncbi:MAG TPA: SAM-dependent methyltransferase, partial [Hyphomonas atlantica]|nr:SAM-dependent methyltransferase [Hyphomonas atlantica]